MAKYEAAEEASDIQLVAGWDSFQIEIWLED